jgi:hypothetical protein
MTKIQRERSERGHNFMVSTGMKSLACIVLALLFTQAAFSQDKTFLQYNGRGWRKFSGEIKLGYVIGFSDTQVCDDDKLPCHMNFGELVEAIDRFYSEPENLLLTVSAAIHFVTRKAAGAEPAAIEKELAQMRSFSNKLVDKTGK